MDGAELAGRFSYITNSLRYCGPSEASGLFIKHLKEKDNESKEGIRNSIKKFEGLYPYLSKIASKHNMDFLDYDVVEAYWIGNPLLDNFSKDDMSDIIRALMQRGLPKSIGEDLITHMPDGFVPHHNFNVLHVGVGRTAGTVETTLSNMDNCRISMGKVVNISKGHIVVETDILQKNENGLFLKEHENKTAIILPEMMPSINKGDIVAMHWGLACMVLDLRQAESLKKCTGMIIQTINRINENAKHRNSTIL